MNILRKKSAALYERACHVLVGGVNSPVRAFRAVGGEPIFVDRVHGPYVFDVDGNRYLDLVGSWGPAIVGHANVKVIEAVQQAAARGLSFGACCEAEATLAELICSALPSIELLRFVNSGTEATMSALRLARAATGRSHLIKFAGCYHGHVDSLLVAAGSGAATLGSPDSAGVPTEWAATTFVAPFNDLNVVNHVVKTNEAKIAAVLVEPVAGNMGYVAPQPEFLEGLRTICNQTGAILIFDEVMTGFRVAWGGYQTRCGVAPDLTCLGKVIGGGLPVAAYGGSRRIMQLVSPLGKAYQAGTLSGNPVAMAAGIATLSLCKTNGFYESLEAKTRRLIQAIQTAADHIGIPLQTDFSGGMFGIAFSNKPLRNFTDAKAMDHQAYARWFQAMLARGVWLPPSSYEAMFMSAAHDDECLYSIVAAAVESFTEIRL